ncbi:isoaspartyl peptidase/L-asparaginase family protein [Dyadobacter fermentans]|uniref:Isoaspartyl peptidase n=1 Tax=Dyadobacter fermentans (strain ATCC 700827 / DSM 18053 / CIP 107007 / KCTC 52180 / NS114) TaxID=471854 RepID=C6VZH1_DYAFD|nr:isoaspartyl peptidase/L-asparaginase [Dyadobacter fermentans]ACT91783.1 peptidase T2 asparaginase 2 [Dyadobacter fermentans DSM 18053]
MFSIAIHGGAGSLDAAALSPAQEKLYHLGLHTALNAGYTILQSGGAAIDAVQHAVMQLEDNPLFNAGRGAVFNSDGVQELDAAMMCGKTLRVGAVAAVTNVKNPILLARKVMEDPQFVLLVAEGAHNYARKSGIPMEEMSYFATPERYQQLQDAKDAHLQKASDTVGAVARDMHGNLAAASSTGGLTNKKYSRVGDSPVIGAGTYAHNDTCAVCCTGDGEYFIRLVTAHDVAAMLQYQGLTLAEACDAAIHEKLNALKGEGGLIAIDFAGNIEMSSNCASMPRGWVKNEGNLNTAIWM